MIKKESRNSKPFVLLFTSVISAFGPFVTDLYLPALPILSKVFHTSTSMVQMSLTVSFLGLAVGQLLFGPLSDKYGRRAPLILSLILFVIATIGCIYAWDIASLIFFRLMQGFAGAGGLVIARSVAVDLYHGDTLAKFLSLLAAIQGLAPIVAPLAGGVLLKFTNWQGIFAVLLFIGVLVLFASFFFKESLVAVSRIKVPLVHTFYYFLPILKNRQFLFYTLAISSAMAVFFGYIASSPFIFQNIYQLSPLYFSVLFAVNAVGFIIGSQLIRFFNHAPIALKAGAYGLVLFVILQALLLNFHAPVFAIEVMFFLIIVCIGTIVPTASAMALDLERTAAGAASAILGFTQFLAGSAVAPLVGIGNVALATGIVLTICGMLCLIFVIAAVKDTSMSRVGR